jgi:tetratricopeptide (TPR) repeat protein
MAGHDMGAMKEIPPPDKLPPPLPMTGIGNAHLSITATPEAQVWFDQGLNLQHDFWNYESARAFEQAVRSDSRCAMCYWGLYESLNFYHSLGNAYAREALDKAVRLEPKVTPKERLYIQATAAEEEEDFSPAVGHATSGDSKATTLWRQAVKLDPNDLQARIFLAISLKDGYDDSGEPKAGTKEAIKVLEDVLKRDPDNSAANHYWIHAMEPSNHPERALVSAQRLASLAPASGHMVHMPGHIFYRVGDYAQAEHWFAASTAVDEAYMRSQHIDVDDDWNYVHNLMYAIANYMEEGKLQAATALSGKLAGARGEFSDTLYTGSPRDDMTRLNTLLPVALRTANWPQMQSLLASGKPDAKLENLLFLFGQLRGFATGMLALESNDLVVAQASSNALDADLWRQSQKLKDKSEPEKPKKSASSHTPVMVAVMPDAEAEPMLSSLSIMSLELRASILAAQKQLPEAKALFAQAAHQEKSLGYREPPAFIRPVGETEGAALLRAGDPEGAHQAYADALVERPNSGFSLYGLARSSEAAGNTKAARTEYARFLKAWKDSDPANPQLAHAHNFLTTPHGGTQTTASLH